VRTRIATDLHDDIASTLSQISVLIEVARRKQKGIAGDPLSTVAELSRDVIDSLGDIVWAINPKRDSLHDLVHRMRRFTGDFSMAGDCHLLFDAKVPPQDVKMGADLRREVFLIFKEGLNNIVRHARCSRAEIEISVDNGWLVLRMHDEGAGFDPCLEAEGNGLTNMRRRAAKLRARLEISSRPGEGTLLRLEVPLSRRRFIRE
jgi:signal transduction histidine kinase